MISGLVEKPRVRLRLGHHAQAAQEARRLLPECLRIVHAGHCRPVSRPRRASGVIRIPSLETWRGVVASLLVLTLVERRLPAIVFADRTHFGWPSARHDDGIVTT